MSSKVTIPSFFKGPDGEPPSFAHKRHQKYFQLCLQMFPSAASTEDNSRLMLAFFSLSALELLDCPIYKTEEEKNAMIDWIYSHQIPARTNAAGKSNVEGLGFRGSNSLGHAYNSSIDNEDKVDLRDTSHIAMTYCALLMLLILDDDLSRVNRTGLLTALGKLQLPNGSFSCLCITGEDEKPFLYNEGDMRFVYCAVIICHILDDFSKIDVEKTVEFIKSSLSYEGGFGQGEHEEGHGGSTFCALASLSLLNRLDGENSALTEEEKDRILRWCLMRQKSGFQGRPNKPEDTCYSFWIGSSIEILGHFDKVDLLSNILWLFSTQRPRGGFAKYAPEDHNPDPVHSYFGVCAFSLMGEDGLRELHPVLNISKRAADNIQKTNLQPIE